MKKDHKEEHKKERKINWRIVIYSLIALGFIALAFLVDWIFIAGAVIMIWLNQRELSQKK